MGTPQAQSEITNSQLLARLFATGFDIDALFAEHALTPERFLELWKDPTVVETIAAWHAAQHLRHSHLAREHQEAAAACLRRVIAESPDPTESRRAATVLSRLAIAMSKPPRAPRNEPDAHTRDGRPPRTRSHESPCATREPSASGCHRSAGSSGATGADVTGDLTPPQAPIAEATPWTAGLSEPASEGPGCFARVTRYTALLHAAGKPMPAPLANSA